MSAKRTPFGTYGGVLKDHSATDLAEHAAKAALAAGGVAPELVNSVIMGNVMQVLQPALFSMLSTIITRTDSDHKDHSKKKSMWKKQYLCICLLVCFPLRNDCFVHNLLTGLAPTAPLSGQERALLSLWSFSRPLSYFPCYS